MIIYHKFLNRNNFFECPAGGFQSAFLFHFFRQWAQILNTDRIKRTKLYFQLPAKPYK